VIIQKEQKDLTMRPLSKSKLMAYRQCPKRVWFEVHHPDLRVDTAASQKSFAIGHQVGEIAQQVYDPTGQGTVIKPYACGFYAHCQSQVPQAERPIAWLPGALKKSLVTLIANKGITELRDVPDHLLNAQQ
jgi:hypothetical protein